MGVWSATPDSDPFISAYVMHFLLEAKDRGVDVPKDMLDAGNKYLQTLAGDESAGTLDELRQRAYAVYLLTRQGNVTTNNLAAVQKRLQDAYPKDWKNDLAAAWLAASYKLMKQDNEANVLMTPLQNVLERAPDNGPYAEGYYNDPLVQDATVLYLLSRHFPERAKTLSPRVMENIARPLERNEFNTLSAAMTMLALDTYAGTNASAVQALGIEEVHGDGSARPISQLEAKLLQAGTFDAATKFVRFTNGSNVPAWTVTAQAGFDRGAPASAIRNGIEIVRDYTDTNGKPLSKVTLGEEIDVHVKIRATGSKGQGNVAIVDLLPGGFDPVIAPPPIANQSSDEGSEQSSAPAFPTISVKGSTWTPDYADIREDRVVIYGEATPDVREFVYRIKASAAGKFIVPPAYGEAMYDRRVQARSPGGGTLTVVHAP
jgi:uncharacterized protein YfaS (alpha-2-macroglobulin family)